MDQFKRIVQNAMGYSSDREDQISVESFPFAYMQEMSMEGAPGTDWPALFKRYGYLGGYAVLILVAFMFLVKPLTKVVQEVAVQTRQGVLTVRAQENGRLPGGEGREALPPPPEMTGRQKATYLARQNVEKTTEQVRGWLTEAS